MGKQRILPQAQEFAAIASLLVLLSVLCLAGCSSSAPRFRSEDRETGGIIQDENEFRFASKIREEEALEDDRKVDLQTVKERLASDTASTGDESLAGVNRDQFLLNVVSYLGAPYLFGGVSKSGIDCSGLISTIYARSLSMALPRSTRDQFQIGTPVQKEELQFGDLVFFNTTGYSPSHVGVFIEDDLFAHASVTQGVTISSLESTYYRKRFVGARRVIR